MKKLLTSFALLAVVFFSGCATSFPRGDFYVGLKFPVAVTNNKLPENVKIGTAECKSVLGLVATGDASIQTACKNGGITVIHHVDWEVENILGIIGTYRCVVYGE